MAESVLDAFCCAVCLEYAIDAVETTCCAHIFCEACVRSLPPASPCPSCRSHGRRVHVEPNLPVRRALSRLPAECPLACGAKGLTRESLESHRGVCRRRPRTCPGCEWRGVGADFARHIVDAHGELLEEHGERLWHECGGAASAIAASGAAAATAAGSGPTDRVSAAAPPRAEPSVHPGLFGDVDNSAY